MDGTNSTTAWTIAGVVALVVIIVGGWLIARERGSSANTTGTATTIATSTDTTTSGATTNSMDNTVGAGTVTTGEVTPMTGTSMTPTPSATASGETVTVSDQAAGTSVMVSNVTLSKPSWVAIKGTNGWVIGAAWFNASAQNVSVPLVKPTVAGETYQAVIYVDDGDKKFTLHAGDTLVTDAQGAPVSSTFKAQ